MPDVFISYSRRDAREFVERLARALEDQGKDPWVDLDDIPPASRWEEDLRDGVAGSDAFCFVISPGSVASQHCRAELAHAVERNKRIVPVNHLEVADDQVPDPVGSHNWVPQQGVFADDFEGSLATLVTAIETDLDWVRTHTRWGTRAEEWERRRRDRSLLARGSDLTAAEGFLAQAADHHPEPTTLQGEFVIASRRAATRRQRQVVGSVSVALVVSLVLAVFALLQRQTALEQRRTALAQRQAATSRALAANAFLTLPTDPELSLLLGLEAAAASPTRQAEDALRSALLASRVRAVLQHDDAVLEAAFSPDGSSVATVSADGTGAVWDAADGSRRATLAGHEQVPTALRWSAAGSRLVTLAQDSTARVWDPASGAPVAVLRDPDDHRLDDAAISSDGKLVVTAGFVNNWVKVWDVASASVVRVIPRKAVDRIALSPDERLLLTAQQGRRVELWRLADGRRLGLYPEDHQRPFSFAGFSPDGRYFATSGIRPSVRVRQPSGRLVAVVHHEGAVNDVAFSPDSRVLATASADGTVKITDLADDRLISTFTGHTDGVNAVAFGPDGRLVVSGGDDDRAFLWRAASGAQVGALVGHGAPIVDVDVDEGGRRIVTGSADGTARVWVASPSGGAFETASVTRLVAGSSFFSEDGRFLLMARPRVSVMDTTTGRVHGGFRLRGEEGLVGAVSPDGTLVVTSENSMFAGRRPRVRRVDDGTVVSRLQTPTVVGADFDESGKRLAVGGVDGVAGVYDVDTGRRLVAFEGLRQGNDIESARFGADDHLVVTTGSDETARVWNAATGEQLIDIRAFSIPFGQYLPESDGQLSPDGQLVVTGAGYESDARLWDVDTGELIATLEGPRDLLEDVAFSPSGRFVVTSYFHGDVRLWEGSSGRALALAAAPDGLVDEVAFTADERSIEMVTAKSVDPPYAGGPAFHVLDCDVCGDLDSLVALARERVTRELTATERDRFVAD